MTRDELVARLADVIWEAEGDTTAAAATVLAEIEAMGLVIVPRHVSHVDAVCPECGAMDAGHAPGCAFSATVQPPR